MPLKKVNAKGKTLQKGKYNTEKKNIVDTTPKQKNDIDITLKLGKRDKKGEIKSRSLKFPRLSNVNNVEEMLVQNSDTHHSDLIGQKYERLWSMPESTTPDTLMHLIKMCKIEPKFFDITNVKICAKELYRKSVIEMRNTYMERGNCSLKFGESFLSAQYHVWYCCIFPYDFWQANKGLPNTVDRLVKHAKLCRNGYGLDHILNLFIEKCQEESKKLDKISHIQNDETSLYPSDITDLISLPIYWSDDKITGCTFTLPYERTSEKYNFYCSIRRSIELCQWNKVVADISQNKTNIECQQVLDFAYSFIEARVILNNLLTLENNNPQIELGKLKDRVSIGYNTICDMCKSLTENICTTNIFNTDKVMDTCDRVGRLLELCQTLMTEIPSDILWLRNIGQFITASQVKWTKEWQTLISAGPEYLVKLHCVQNLNDILKETYKSEVLLEYRALEKEFFVQTFGMMEYNRAKSLLTDSLLCILIRNEGTMTGDQKTELPQNLLKKKKEDTAKWLKRLKYNETKDIILLHKSSQMIDEKLNELEYNDLAAKIHEKDLHKLHTVLNKIEEHRNYCPNNNTWDTLYFETKNAIHEQALPKLRSELENCGLNFNLLGNIAARFLNDINSPVLTSEISNYCITKLEMVGTDGMDRLKAHQWEKAHNILQSVDLFDSTTKNVIQLSPIFSLFYYTMNLLLCAQTDNTLSVKEDDLATAELLYNAFLNEQREKQNTEHSQALEKQKAEDIKALEKGVTDLEKLKTPDWEKVYNLLEHLSDNFNFPDLQFRIWTLEAKWKKQSYLVLDNVKSILESLQFPKNIPKCTELSPPDQQVLQDIFLHNTIPKLAETNSVKLSKICEVAKNIGVKGVDEIHEIMVNLKANNFDLEQNLNKLPENLKQYIAPIVKENEENMLVYQKASYYQKKFIDLKADISQHKLSEERQIEAEWINLIELIRSLYEEVEFTMGEVEISEAKRLNQKSGYQWLSKLQSQLNECERDFRSFNTPKRIEKREIEAAFAKDHAIRKKFTNDKKNKKMTIINISDINNELKNISSSEVKNEIIENLIIPNLKGEATLEMDQNNKLLQVWLDSGLSEEVAQNKIPCIDKLQTLVISLKELDSTDSESFIEICENFIQQITILLQNKPCLKIVKNISLKIKKEKCIHILQELEDIDKIENTYLPRAEQYVEATKKYCTEFKGEVRKLIETGQYHVDNDIHKCFEKDRGEAYDSLQQLLTYSKDIEKTYSNSKGKWKGKEACQKLTGLSIKAEIIWKDALYECLKKNQDVASDKEKLRMERFDAVKSYVENCPLIEQSIVQSLDYQNPEKFKTALKHNLDCIVDQKQSLNDKKGALKLVKDLLEKIQVYSCDHGSTEHISDVHMHILKIDKHLRNIHAANNYISVDNNTNFIVGEQLMTDLKEVDNSLVEKIKDNIEYNKNLEFIKKAKITIFSPISAIDDLLSKLTPSDKANDYIFVMNNWKDVVKASVQKLSNNEQQNWQVHMSGLDTIIARQKNTFSKKLNFYDKHIALIYCIQKGNNPNEEIIVPVNRSLLPVWNKYDIRPEYYRWCLKTSGTDIRQNVSWDHFFHKYAPCYFNILNQLVIKFLNKPRTQDLGLLTNKEKQYFKDIEQFVNASDEDHKNFAQLFEEQKAIQFDESHNFTFQIWSATQKIAKKPVKNDTTNFSKTDFCNLSTAIYLEIKGSGLIIIDRDDISWAKPGQLTLILEDYFAVNKFHNIWDAIFDACSRSGAIYDVPLLKHAPNYKSSNTNSKISLYSLIVGILASMHDISEILNRYNFVNQEPYVWKSPYNSDFIGNDNIRYKSQLNGLNRTFLLFSVSIALDLPIVVVEYMFGNIYRVIFNTCFLINDTPTKLKKTQCFPSTLDISHNFDIIDDCSLYSNIDVTKLSRNSGLVNEPALIILQNDDEIHVAFYEKKSVHLLYHCLYEILPNVVLDARKVVDLQDIVVVTAPFTATGTTTTVTIDTGNTTVATATSTATYTTSSSSTSATTLRSTGQCTTATSGKDTTSTKSSFLPLQITTDEFIYSDNDSDNELDLAIDNINANLFQALLSIN